MDDCLTEADTDNSALKLHQDISNIKIAAFNLKKWASILNLVKDSIDPDKKGTSLLMECDSSEPLRSLGVLWDLN